MDGGQPEVAVLYQTASQLTVPSQTQTQALNYSAAFREWLIVMPAIQRTSRMEERTSEIPLLTRKIVKETPGRD